MLGRSKRKQASDSLVAWLRRKGKAVPEQLTNESEEPRIDADLLPVWRAWHELMDGRAVGDGEGLSWADLSRWCEDYEVHGEERRRFCRLLKAMDRAYVRHINEAVASGDSGTTDRRERDAARGAAGGTVSAKGKSRRR